MIMLPTRGAVSVKNILDRAFHPLNIYFAWICRLSVYIFFMQEQSSQVTRFQGEHARIAEVNTCDAAFAFKF